MNIDDKLKELNISLPKAPDPVGAYVAFKKVDKLLFISGQLPIDINGKMIKGKIGKDLTLDEGQKASKLCVVNILAQAKKEMDIVDWRGQASIDRLINPNQSNVTENVEDMGDMFYLASSFDQSVERWNINKVTNGTPINKDNIKFVF